MARRKRHLSDDDDSDSVSSENEDHNGIDLSADARDERALFEDPYQRKRRRKNGKNQALYGVFADDDEDEEDSRPRKRHDWVKAPAFVSSDKKVNLAEEMDVDDVENGSSEGEDEGQENVSDDSQPSRPPSPRIHDEDGDTSDAAVPMAGIGSSRAGLGSSKGGIGHSRGGIGTSKATLSSIAADESFTSAASSSFIRDDAQRAPKPVKLSRAEQVHFTNISGSFGARMLAKMGWQAGQGLGATGEGIATPVESKARPQRVGLAFRGFKERTEQSIREARRRAGEDVSDEEEDDRIKKARKKQREAQERRSDVWKQPKKVKTKVEHRTYEEIMAQAGEQSATSGLGQIIDATGAVPKEVSSLADISLNSWIPSADPTRIPEVRHNIRLIAEACKTDLDGLAREAKGLAERKKFVQREDQRLRKKVDEEAELIARLQKVQLVANDIHIKSTELASVYEASLESLSPIFYTLIVDFSPEVQKYNLDEIVVAAIAPIFRRLVVQWNPLEEPSAFIDTFRSWSIVLPVSVEEKPKGSEIDIYGVQRASVQQPVVEKPMTPFESLLWNVWLPKVRAVMNNDWDPHIAQPAVKLFEAWSTFLPPFMRDNFLDQLVMPKLHSAVAAWNARQDTGVTLESIVFPWLPHLGLRADELVGDAKRRIKSSLRHWVVGRDIPSGLTAWKNFFDSGDWDAMILKYIVPKLGETLRNDFRVNPRNQNMEPLQNVLLWSDHIRSTIFSQLLETEFFPKWLDVLHIWLIQPNVNFEEVAQWYAFWKGSFPSNVQEMAGVSRGFTRGLQLMNKAIELGPDAPAKLPHPDFRPEQAASPTKDPSLKVARPSARTHEITFRSIVEEYVADHNLLLLPTGRAHEKSRMPLFRVSPTADGKGGILIYMLDDAVWASRDGVGGPSEDYRAISLDDMVNRANTAL